MMQMISEDIQQAGSSMKASLITPHTPRVTNAMRTNIKKLLGLYWCEDQQR